MVLLYKLTSAKCLCPFQRSFHIFCFHLGAVMELDAFLQCEVPNSIADIFICIHQVGLGLHLHIRIEQSAVSQQIHVGTGCGVVIRWMHRRGLTHGGDHNGIFCFPIASVALVAAAVVAAASQQTNGHGAHKQQAEHARFPVSHTISPHKNIFNRMGMTAPAGRRSKLTKPTPFHLLSLLYNPRPVGCFVFVYYNAYFSNLQSISFSLFCFQK